MERSREDAQMDCSRRKKLERRSDELLAENESDCDEEYPCHTERWMQILARREAKQDAPPAAPGGEIEAALARMVVDANLTRRQRMVIRWIVRGVSQRQIAEMLGVSESQVSRIKSAAWDRLRREGVRP